ncbi:MAG: hypothetical protein WD073_10725 [Xanthobacteraceae bacterium]
MSDTTPTETAFADLHTGVVRTLAAICRQLIEARVLNKDLLVSSLIEVGSVLKNEGVGPVGMTVPAALIAALQQSAEIQP